MYILASYTDWKVKHDDVVIDTDKIKGITGRVKEMAIS